MSDGSWLGVLLCLPLKSIRQFRPSIRFASLNETRLIKAVRKDALVQCPTRTWQTPQKNISDGESPRSPNAIFIQTVYPDCMITDCLAPIKMGGKSQNNNARGVQEVTQRGCPVVAKVLPANHIVLPPATRPTSRFYLILGHCLNLGPCNGKPRSCLLYPPPALLSSLSFCCPAVFAPWCLSLCVVMVVESQQAWSLRGPRFFSMQDFHIVLSSSWWCVSLCTKLSRSVPGDICLLCATYIALCFIFLSSLLNLG